MLALKAEWPRRLVFQKLQRLNDSSPVLALVVLVFFFLYVWLQSDPSLQYHSTRSVFLVGSEFLGGFIPHPGGIVEYAAAFAAQFGQVAWLGALLLTVGAISIACVTREFLSRTGQVPTRSLHLVPVFFLLLLGNQYDYPLWRTMLGLLVSLGFALGYVSMPSWTGWLRWTVFWLGSLLLCYGAGAGPCFLFAVLGALFESIVRRRSLLAAGCLCAAGAVPFGAAFFLNTDLAGEFKHWGKGSTLWLTLGLYLFFPLAIFVRRAWDRHGASEVQRAETNAPCQLKSHLLWVLFALTAGSAFLTFDANRKALLQVDHFAERGKWDEVLQAAPRIQGFTVSSFLHINRALFHSGRMASDMFAFHQFKGLDLLPGLNMGLGHCRAVSGTLLELGQVNVAEHFAHEALESEGDHPALLHQLARINVLKDRPQAARVFLNLLRKIPFQRDQAKRWLCDLDSDPRLSQQSDIARIRPLMPASDSPESHVPAEMLLEQLLQSNRKNRMAFEYLMAHYLLTAQLDKLVQNLGRLDDFDYPKIPRHYEEAILLRQRLAGESKIDLRGRRIDLETAQRFEKFDAEVVRFKNRREEARAALAAEFGDTYWFYYLFGQFIGRKPSTMSEAEQ